MTLDEFVRNHMDGQSLPDHQREAREAIEAAVRGKAGLSGGIVVLMPPRFGKTNLAHQVLDWYLTVNPGGAGDARVAGYFSYSQDVADSMRARLGRQLTEGALDRSLFVCGRGCGTLGRSLDLIVLDDPVKTRFEAESKAVQNQLRDWFETSVLTRLRHDGAFVFLGTRWGEDDFAAWLMRTFPDWPVVTIRAFDEQGNPTWPDQHGPRHLQSLKESLSADAWTYLYQQGEAPAAP